MGYVGLIIEEPPRHGKSELTSHYLPAWFLGTFPDKRVMLASYQDTFASSWGGKARDTLNMIGPDIFGIQVNPKRAAADWWDVAGRKGGMVTAGVGGQFTGRGADLLIADDLVKNWEEAQSETIRNKAWNFWRSTARTRLEPGGVICVIGTRWHEDDIIGRLLAMQGDSPEGENHELYDEHADRYLRVRLPMLAEGPDDVPEDEEYVPDPLGRAPGEALWRERYDEMAARNIRATSRAIIWAAMYQQRPAPVEGAMFQRDWFEVVPPPSCKVKAIRRWDLAGTEEGEGDDPDWTAGVKIGLGEDGVFYVLDVVRFRDTPGGNEKRIAATAARDGRKVKIRMEQEPGQSGKAQIVHYRRKILRSYQFRGRRSTGDKVIRAETAAGYAEAGDIKVVRGPWNKEFLRELTRFPNGAHDDQVDAFAGCIDDLTSKSNAGIVTL